MKNKKGFTLVELLVVITLIGLLVVIAVPSGIAVSNKVKKNMLDKKIELIESAAIAWGQQNKKQLKDTCGVNEEIYDDCLTTSISNLLQENALEPDGTNTKGDEILKNPVNEKELNDCKVAIYIKNKRVYAEYDKSTDPSACYNGQNKIEEPLPDGTILLYDAILRDNEVTDPITAPGKAPSGGYSERDYVKYVRNLSTTDQTTKYYAYSDSYTFDQKTGLFSLNNPIIATYAEVSSDLANKYVSSHNPSSSNIIKTTGLAGISMITSAPAASTSSYVTIGYTTKDRTVGTIPEAVLAETQDDYGTSYYFRGAVENNFVTFSGMCWRIVRIQGDRTIKLVLADRDNVCSANTTSTTTETFEKEDEGEITITVYNGYSTLDDSSAFISHPKKEIFPYEAANVDDMLLYETSNIPTILNTWMNGGEYKNNDGITGTFAQKISEEDQKKLATTFWCNDMSIVSKEYYDQDGNDVFDEYLSEEWREYIGYGFGVRSEPNLKCNFKGLENTKAVRYKSNIGILTADEVEFAGAGGGISSNFYLKTNANAEDTAYWTMTPEGNENMLYPEYEDYAWPTIVVATHYDTSRDLSDDLVWIEFGYNTTIRPSVVLRSDVFVETTGNGTQSNPYVVK